MLIGLLVSFLCVNTFAGSEDIQQILENDLTSLSLAIETKDSETLKSLLHHRKINPNQKMPNGLYPLFQAIEAEDEKSVLTLLAYGADPNQTVITGFTHLQVSPLTEAIEGNLQGIVDILLNGGADPNLVLRNTNTGKPGNSLTVAITEQNKNIILSLLRHGAKPNQLIEWPDSEFTPLLCAILKDDEPIVDLLLSYQADPNQDIAGVTPLYLASRWGELEIVRTLLRYGAKPNQVSPANGLTALQVAAKKDRSEVVLELLAHGADPCLFRDRPSALGYAYSKGHLEVCNLLIHSGKVNLKREIVTAGYSGDSNLLEYLIFELEEKTKAERELIEELNQLATDLRNDPEHIDGVIKKFGQIYGQKFRKKFGQSLELPVADKSKKSSALKMLSQELESELASKLLAEGNFVPALLLAWSAQDAHLFSVIARRVITDNLSEHRKLSEVKFEPNYNGFIQLLGYVVQFEQQGSRLANLHTDN